MSGIQMKASSGASAEAQSAEEGTKRMQTLQRMFRYLLREKVKLTAVIILLTIGTLAFTATSILMGQVIDLLSGSQDMGKLTNMVILMVVAASVAFACLYLQFRWLAEIAQEALYQLRKELFEHMMTLSLNFFDRQPIGQLMSSVTNDMDAVTALFQGALNQLVQGVVMLVITIIAMLALNITLTVVALLTIPALMLLAGMLGRAAGPAFELLQQKLSNLNGLMEETIAGERTVIAYRQQQGASDALAIASLEARNAGARALIVANFINPLTNMITYIGLAMIALFGSYLIGHQSLSIGNLVSFMSLAQLFIIPLFQVFSNYDAILSAAAGAERVFNILDEVPQIKDKPGAVPLKQMEGHVVLKHVDFSYVKGRKILKDNSFEAFPGQMIGLCGPTGAGKSTIINLLTRYYDIDSGEIYIDDQNIYDVTQSSLRQQIGVVLQEPFLFSDTVMANLLYARQDATEEECIDAAKRANCHDFIMRLPNGYQTVLAERGSNLSQGQRQLLTIARAMVSNPRALILDEATSNVDTRTEHAIQEAIRELQKGRTSFVIAHRLSTIRHADQILVINNGEIVERGTHAQMMANRGFYYDLYMSQYKGKVADILPEGS